jgi:hypothetical protein
LQIQPDGTLSVFLKFGIPKDNGDYP